jgi:outer membrane immunogenic protein
MKEITMKRILMAGAAFGLLATSALAADLGYRRNQGFSAPIMAVNPAFSWTGFYAGLNGGLTWGSNQANFPNNFDTKHSGLIVGAQAGYNYQFNPQFVLGVEGDINYVGSGLSRSFVNGLGTSVSLKRDSGWLGTLRGRVGFTPIERLMLYGTAGLAFGNSDMSATVTTTAVGTPTWSGKSGEAKFGYAIGAGAEYAFGSNWSIKGEYLYYGLGSSDAALSAVNAAAAGTTPQMKLDNKAHVLRAGVNYKF